MSSTASRTPRLAAVLSAAGQTPLTIGQEAAQDLGLAALEHLEGSPAEADLRSLVVYAARHEETAPARDALVAVLLNASGTLPATLVQRARAEVRKTDWGGGREAAAPTLDPDVGSVPRRKALAERLLAERARRLRPRMHAYVAAILAAGPEAPAVPSWFLERNWLDLRDTLAQRVRAEPMHRESIARWLRNQQPAVRARLRHVEDVLIDVATQAILQNPQRAPLAPYVGDERVAEAVRTAVQYRGEPARARLATYLSRLTPGTAWYAAVKAIMARSPTSAG
ncbi:MAG TPA: hypothetical protein VMM18_15020 [Gemmatimonadaceae bacterium]|nr:hypothetical protein [Gemmatimonadaceae bacterium]